MSITTGEHEGTKKHTKKHEDSFGSWRAARRKSASGRLADRAYASPARNTKVRRIRRSAKHDLDRGEQLGESHLLGVLYRRRRFDYSRDNARRDQILLRGPSGSSRLRVPTPVNSFRIVASSCAPVSVCRWQRPFADASGTLGTIKIFLRALRASLRALRVPFHPGDIYFRGNSKT